jgi:TM2 domain-containing membrane protein YozV
MKGHVLTYDPLTAEGLISDEDGNRYGFAGSEWKGSPHQLRSGAQIDFSPEGANAVAIYAISGSSVSANPLSGEQKSPIVAGLLALFLGGLGIHKFYLGYNQEGVILLVATIISWILTVVVIGVLGLMAVGVICLVEAIIYLTKSQDEFARIYVENKRPWF